MIKLNLGCGNDVMDGYINIDLRKTHPSVVICDATNLDSIIDDGTVYEIRAVDVLEHIPYSKTVDVLKHWYDKLRPGGLLFIQSTCLKSLANYILDAKTPGQIENVIARIFGGQNYKENFHYTVIDQTLMKEYLDDVGFTEEPKFETEFGNKTNIRMWIIK